MPTMRKLPPTTVAAIERRDPIARTQIAAQYDALLEAFAPGDHGQADLEPGDTPTPERSRRPARMVVALDRWAQSGVSGARRGAAERHI